MTIEIENLIETNMKYVVGMAKQYQNQGLSMSELIVAGTEGLMNAAHRYKGTEDYKFSSFAIWWIRQAILQALADALHRKDDTRSLLSERERSIVEMCFGINRPRVPLEEIGKQYAISEGRVRQICERTVRKLLFVAEKGRK